MVTYCEEHDDCLVVYESNTSCPVCAIIDVLEDDLEVANNEIKELEKTT